jgi:hypothetical protein
MSQKVWMQFMFAGRLIEQQEDCTHAYHVQFPTKKIFGGF